MRIVRVPKSAWLSVRGIALLVAAVALLTFGAAITMSQENDCQDCSLAGQSFELQDLSGAIFSGANLYGASFRGARLVGTDFTGDNLTRADLEYADLTNAQLIGADMTGANMYGARTTGAVTGASTICPDETTGPCEF